MKGSLDRMKVVLRHLPPTISELMLVEQLDSRFAGRYNWLSFRPGKISNKHQLHARAYINFNRPEDVFEFAEFFDGHVFVNEKGTQSKVIVEYAPSQRVPKQWSKKDGRESTILKDPEYQEFLEFLAKPVENLPSAEIQLERKEAERVGAGKEALVVTPLMDYVRKRRAAKSGVRKQISNGKTTRRVTGASIGSLRSSSAKRGSKKMGTSTMYVLRESSKGTGGKDKSNFIVVSERDGQQLLDKSAANGVSGGPGSSEMGKKKILLLKGKEKEIPNVIEGLSSPHTTLSMKNSPNSNVAKQNQRRESGGRIVKSILLNKESRQNQSSTAVQSEQQLQIEKDRRLPRAPVAQAVPKDMNVPSEDKVGGNNGHHFEKQERRTRNRERPDRGVWTPLRRSDGSHASNESLTSSQPNQSSEYIEGSYRYSGHRGSTQNLKDEGASVADGKTLKRTGSSGYASNEKQVWIQKSGSGS